MREFTIHKNDADQRLDRFLLKAVPLLPASLAQKYIRLKRIKVNGARAERDCRLREGDRLSAIAKEEYGSCGAWRLIAQENGIENPRTLRSGRTIRIPAMLPEAEE